MKAKSSIFFWQTTIGKKFVMAGTGLMLCLFLLGHLVGNLLLYVGAEAFNAYADFLNSTSAIYFVEFGLLAITVLHIVIAIKLSLENKKARPKKYVFSKTAGKSTFMSRYMLHSGAVILIFIIMHIGSFKFGEWDNQGIKYDQTLFDLVVNSFSKAGYSLFYVIAMIFLGFHLYHAIKSSLITLGIAHKSTINIITKTGAVFSIIIAAGFSSFPIYFFLQSII